MRMSRQFPAVLLTGPRQCGKTALLRKVFPHASYVTLDVPGHAAAAMTDGADFILRFKEPLIIDEVQYAPAFFRTLKILIDKDRRPGRFLLTGSQVFPLMQGVSESLAGRCGVLELQTLSWAEAGPRSISDKDFLFLGGFPELHAGGRVERDFWYPSYLATYLERDVRNVLGIGDLGDYDRFLRACGLRTSRMLSYSDLARDVGIAPNTAKKWVSVLTATGGACLLESYHRNLGKRLIKAPKLHLCDSGLAAYLAGFQTTRDAFASPLAGGLWESFVIGQIRRCYAFRGLRPPVWYWRTPSGAEVDAVIEEGGGKLTAVECKLTEHPKAKDCAGILALRMFYGKGSVTRAFVACRTPARHEIADGVMAVGVDDLCALLGRA